ncbi:MAG: glycosyltransferase family 4 protein [Actinomycetota bacterium]|nr:glycosyltransferase family 4 protein [Actinomycetota bacterium]
MNQISGGLVADPARPRVLVVGHASGAHLFGGERSLLQLLELFGDIGFDVVVALPPSENGEYLSAVIDRCTELCLTAIPPRLPHQSVDEQVVATFASIITRHGVVAVHANTIVPREPLIAARRCGVAAVVHAREIPAHDPELSQWLQAAAGDLVASVLAEADYVVANSLATSRAYPLPGRVAIVPNFVDIHEFDRVDAHDARAGSDAAPRVALIGSTTEKKGVREFVDLAVLLATLTDARFVIVGPDSPLTQQLQAEGLPPNLHLAGYAHTPAAALRQADIVVNLSHCEESFGRSLMEAMAAGLPTVAFARGALVELVAEGETGWLVPPDDLSLLAHRVLQLCRDPQLRSRMGAAGRRAMAQRFTRQHAAAALRVAYHAILPGEQARRQAASDIVVRLPMANRSHHLHQFFVGNRASFAHVSAAAPDRALWGGAASAPPPTSEVVARDVDDEVGAGACRAAADHGHLA